MTKFLQVFIDGFSDVYSTHSTSYHTNQEYSKILLPIKEL